MLHPTVVLDEHFVFIFQTMEHFILMRNLAVAVSIRVLYPQLLQLFEGLHHLLLQILEK
jgi:hypothetical protein